MKCDEELLALHAGGDLSEEEGAMVASHVAECAGCRRLLAEFQALREGSRSLGTEELPGMWPRVHAALRPRRHVWGWIVPVAVAAGLAAVFLIPDRVAPPPMPRAGVVVPFLTGGAPPRPRRSPARLPARQARVPTPQGPLVVKLVTDDPDVVIYWLVDGTKGD